MSAPLVNLAFAGLLVSAPATERNELAWTAPTGCPDADDVERSIEALLGRSFEEPRFDPVEAEATVTEREDRWHLHLRVTTASGSRTRSLRGTSCQELADVAAVLVAIAIDPSIEVPRPQEPEIDRPEPEAETEPPAPEPPEQVASGGERDGEKPEAEKSARAPLPRGTIRLATGALAGPLPTIAPGIAAQLGATWRFVRVDLRASYWFERTARLDEASGEFRLWAFQPRACGIPRTRWVEFPLCLGMQLGAMTGQGREIPITRTGRLAWVALDGAAEAVVVPWRFLGFVAGAELVIPLVRPGFAIDDLGLLHRAGPIAGAFWLGLETRFP